VIQVARSSRPEDEVAHLYEAHAAEILAFCRRALGAKGDPEDALQTTFVYAFRALRRGVVPEHAAAWLTAIAKNVCRTEHRTINRRAEASHDVDLDGIALARPEPDDVNYVSALRSALADLPDNQRNAIVMREWQGLAPGEIAARLQLTTGATNALLCRARRSMASALTTTVRRPLSALNAGLLADTARTWLKTAFGSAVAKTAVVAVVVSVGGVAVERSITASPSAGAPPSVPTASAAAHPAVATRGVGQGTSRDPVASPARGVPRHGLSEAHGSARAATQAVQTTPMHAPSADPPSLTPLAPIVAPVPAPEVADRPKRDEPDATAALPSVDGVLPLPVLDPTESPAPDVDLPPLPEVPVGENSGDVGVSVPALPPLP
jgi:RNA polymerase sigma factor (sigma-70 family)